MTTPVDLAAQARQGLAHIEAAILRLLEAHPAGLRNVQIARFLGLQSGGPNRQKNYLTYSVLGGLLAQGKVERDTSSPLFRPASGDASAPGAARGVAQIESAIVQLLERHPAGLRNVDIAEQLGLHSSFQGGWQDYLTYSVLGNMLARGQVAWDEETKLFSRP